MMAKPGRGQDTELAHLALAAHLVPVIQALLLGGAQRVPGHNEVTEGNVHLAISFCLSCGESHQAQGEGQVSPFRLPPASGYSSGC